MWRRIRRWLKRRWKRYQYWRGWRICRACRSWQRIKCTKITVLYPDEPPMFYEWHCTGCGHSTGIMPSILTTDAVKKLGYADFNDYARRNGLVRDDVFDQIKKDHDDAHSSD